MTAVWEREPLAKRESGWHDDIQVGRKGDTVEVGVLSEEEADERGEIKLGGWIMNVGQDEKASMFSPLNMFYCLEPRGREEKILPSQDISYVNSTNQTRRSHPILFSLTPPPTPVELITNNLLHIFRHPDGSPPNFAYPLFRFQQQVLEQDSTPTISLMCPSRLPHNPVIPLH